MPPKRKRTVAPGLSKSAKAAAPKKAKPTTTRSSKQGNSSTKAFVTPRQAKYPPWSTLPLIPLSRVLELASTDDSGRDAAWLLGAATVCQSFYDPAITLLYENPPCLEQKKFTRLLNTVKANPALGGRIRKLTPSHALSLSPKFVELLLHTPNLKDFNYDSDWQGWFNTATLSYPGNLFSTMREAGIKLRSWTWNAIIGNKLNDPPVIRYRSESYVNRSPKFMLQFHKEHETFATLRILKLKYFVMTYPDDQEEEDLADERAAATAIESLRYLEELSLEKCMFCSNRFLSLLTKQKFSSFTIENCSNLDAEGLAAYLRRQGSEMISLSVKMNPNISLEFASALNMSTPKLRYLEYDPRHFDVGEEGLDSVLPETAEAPAWPKSLISLNLRHLMPWSSIECVRLLQSLLDGAESGSLANLRDLHIWAIVQNLDWRERSEMRKKWTPAIFEAFLDHSKDEYKALSASMKSKGARDGGVAYAADTSNVCQRITFRIDNSRPGAMELDEDDFLDSGPVLSRRRTTLKSVRASRPLARASAVRRKAKHSDDETEGDADFSASEPSYGSQSSGSE